MASIDMINKRLGDGDRVEMTRSEWFALCEYWREVSAHSNEASSLRDELDRVKRVSRPLWIAARHVRDQMDRAIDSAVRANAHVALEKVRNWRIALDCAMQVRISDLPAGHRAHSEFRR